MTTPSGRRRTATAETTSSASVQPYAAEPGRAHPLGATVDSEGVNFSVFSRNATSMELLLFDEHDDPEPIQVITLTPEVNRSFFFWHVYVRGLKPGAHYAYRVDGPWDLTGQGHRFNRNKVLIDPYSLGNTTHLWDRVAACGPADNLAQSMRSVVIDPDDYDWEGDQPLNRPMNESVIYEMHVGGFTKSPTSGVKAPGTFSAIIEKIPYLKQLGITAIELLPVFQFDDKEVLRLSPIDGRPLLNFWGYSTVSFFAPHPAYCASPEEGTHLREFRDMVKALHRAGIEVILDVVFNHTNEGNHEGPVINFKGFENSVYYHLVPQDRRYYMDYSGCGNTMNCNHPVTEKFIVECLEYWVSEMHVDGFRFDEGSILSRGEDGAPEAHPPVVWAIELSEVLANTKIIAEAWDAAGLYQIGYFPGFRWAEWNGKYRDDIRSFVKGDPGLVGAVASRIAGSADIYQSSGHLPLNSVNFVTCHDGFTLNDLVSYNWKHNEANGEGNRDGVDDNDSWNCGAEGDTDDPGVNALRERQVKNFAAILLLSQGVPMLLGGDEIRRTQRGNNNAYCQDSDISWFDWQRADQQQPMYQFFSKLIAFRKAHPTLHRSRFFTGEVNERGVPDITWHGCALESPGWNDPGARVLACTLGGIDGGPDMHIIYNMDWQELDFALPSIKGHRWHRSIDTSQAFPNDVAPEGSEQLVEGDNLRVAGRSVVVLVSRPDSRL